MKKLYCLIVCLIFSSFVSKAQPYPYGNEWINFSTNQQYSVQQYFKITVWRDGIFRITPSDLQGAQFPASFNPKQLQLFTRGVEQFIHVEGEADGSFDPGDYIEFYGLHNDGWFDTRMYSEPDFHVKKTYSLFTDTASYFLTLNANPLITNRRMVHETDVNFIGYTPLSYFIRETEVDYAVEYNAYQLLTIMGSEYDEGEGWYGDRLQGLGPFSYQIGVPNVSTDPAAPIATATSTLMGGNYNVGIPHYITLNVNGTAVTDNLIGYGVIRYNFNLSSNTDLSSGTANFLFSPIDSGGVVHQNLVSFIRMTYPHTFSLQGETSNYISMKIPGNLSAGKSYISLTDLNVANPKLYMLSGDTLKLVSMIGTGTNREALVPTYNGDKFCFITDSIYTSAGGNLQIEPVSDDQTHFAQFTNFLYNTQGADYLIVAHRSLWTNANAYKDHRALNYTPLLVDVEELYDQFAYGIAQHPLSINNFCRFTKDNFLLKPEYMLLIGKSVKHTRTRHVPAIWSKNLVPSYGETPSDMLLGSRLATDTIPRAEIKVGRISASYEVDVQNYLDKIIVHEQQLQQCPQEWMKQILHFGGGGNVGEQQDIKQVLDSLEAIIEDTLMGANVITLLKTTTDPIQIDLSQALQARIDSGVTMMTFVAHASGTTFDINTDIPQNYNNINRYPLMFANSCLVGDIHDPSRRIVEDFVLLPEKGAIGFIAQPGVGFLGYLEDYCKKIYKQIALLNYGGTVGNTMANAIDSVYALPAVTANQETYFLFKSVCTGMTLSGDPALVLNSFDKPDYTTSNANLYFTPTTVTSELDSFNVNVVVTNLGMAVNDPITIHLTRHFPDGTTIFEKDTVIPGVAYKDTITFQLPVDNVNGVGVNFFDVQISSNIAECNPGNNSASNVILQIQSADIIPVYPAEFSIVPQGSNIKLKASTISPFLPPKPYVFQIDTVDTFNSPFLQQGTVTSPGGVVKWPLPFTLSQNLVYYWRVSRDSIPGDTIHPNWNESSFIHKQDTTGWSQAHYSQFKKDKFTNITYSNSYNNTFTFITNTSSLLVRNYMYPNPPSAVPSIEINSVIVDYGLCTYTPSIHIFVIDPISLDFWHTGNHELGQINHPCVGCCRNRIEGYFIYRADPAGMAILRGVLKDSIPDGHYIGLYSVVNPQYTTWDPLMIDELNNWGATLIDNMQNGNPYIFFTKAGDNSFTQEVAGDSLNQIIQLTKALGGNWDRGFVQSVPIGPASGWTALHWEQFPLENPSPQDSAAIDIIGIQPNGQEVPVPGFQGIQVSTPDLNISSIDPVQYPRLRLRAYLQDTLLYTPPQLDRWQIYFDEVPEFALNPAMHFVLNQDTLQEGSELNMEMAIENIGNVHGDSLLVDFYIFDNNHVRHNISSPKYDETDPDDTIISRVSFNTGGFDGLNSLWIEANPHNDQPEQYHLNNLAEILFRVERDITNPILEVTFDGVHILNGDIISGKPLIIVKLKDENLHLALDDTSDWQFYIKDPDGIQTKLFFEPGACSGPADLMLKWCPANLPQNTFTIEYKPIFTKDGIYELWVQATDVSGNISGDNDYRITFEVINKATITNVINYPNPFSTSTKFVFTLTGSEIPEYFKIQIMTISGKVVREIMRDELGPIHIGRNITEYAWNGRDEFGDQLANGIYLYRVLTKLNGENIEKRSTGADQYFTKGWGKMYLMR